jgi:hypothetical protein
MFGLAKTERLLLMKMIGDRDLLIEKLEFSLKERDKLVVNERLRAEGAINLLLLRTQKAVLTPNPEMAQAAQEKMLDSMADMYGSENPNMTPAEEAKIIEEIQKI